jgi:hypothetical protein
MLRQGTTAQERNTLRTSCHICHLELRATSLQRHLASAHQEFTLPTQQLPARFFGAGGTAYEQVSIPEGRQTKIGCPVPDFPGTATNGYDMRKQFMVRHPLDEIVVTEEGQLP